jgi:predicted ABC-type ATPase
MSSGKRVLIIAGPNGAGKSTFAREYLPKEADCLVFVNADLIAAGLSPFDPAMAAIRAGRLMLEEIDRHTTAGRSFAFETTLSGLIYARRIPEWQAARYRVKLIFLSLPSAEMAIARVAARVRQGGHGIPEDVIRRRYAAGWKNFTNNYQELVDAWVLYDNSGDPPRFIRQGEKHERSV